MLDFRCLIACADLTPGVVIENEFDHIGLGGMQLCTFTHKKNVDGNIRIGAKLGVSFTRCKAWFLAGFLLSRQKLNHVL